MGKLKRSYPPSTLKNLFGLSDNQCAFPKCKIPVIEPSTRYSESVVIGQISHIYALSENGPRGKAGFSQEDLNAPQNLILLCPTHHALVDGQPETYPADLLKSWKQAHEELVARKSLPTDTQRGQTEIFPHRLFPIELVDQKIDQEMELIRKSRFFSDVDSINSALLLARKLQEGDLSGGSDPTKSKALAWCARILAPKDADLAEELLTAARRLAACQEIQIADAFISSQRGNRRTALHSLAVIDSPASRSASLMVIASHDGPQGALDWLKAADMDASHVDPDGKCMLLVHQLRLDEFKAAVETADAVSEEDLRETPALHHLLAMSYLLSAVPADFRTVVSNHVPLFDAANFPLHSDAAAMDARRKACRHFNEAAKIVQELKCPEHAWVNEEYALWLELTDQKTFEKGKQRLVTKLSGVKPPLRLVPLGLQFGIKPDLATLEQEIERQIVLHGGTSEEAEVAHFFLLTQRSADQAAQYLISHEDTLANYFGRQAVRCFQIEFLCRAGLPEKAKECLEILLKEGVPQEIENRIRTLIAEAEGTSDPVEGRKVQYERTKSLPDLVVLVDELESQQEWENLCEYGATLFAETRSLGDATRLARALQETHRTDQLVELLDSNADFMSQSRVLPMLYCYGLYQEGELLKARSKMANLVDNGGVDEDENYRELRVNLALFLGDWSSLGAFVAEECESEENRNVHELIRATQLSLSLGMPHTRQLIMAVATKGPDDAEVLMAAHNLATRAGLEGEVEAVKWLHRAVELSGSEGPIQRMTLKEILDRKPAWDRHENKTVQLLNRGEIPMTLAAQSLNRSVIHLMLFPAIENLSKSDPRGRRPIPAYSGKRQSAPFDSNDAVGMDVTALFTLSFLDILDTALDAFNTVYVPHSTLGWLFQEKQRAAFHQPSRIRDAHQLRNLLATDALERWVSGTVADSDLAAHVGDELALLITEARNAGEDADTQRVVIQPTPVYQPASMMNEEADMTAHADIICSCSSVVDKLRQRGQITAEEARRARAYLQLQEKPWPQQPEINEGAILYLSGMAVTYFLHLELLEKLRPAGFRAVVSPREVSEADQLIAYESLGSMINDKIEEIRSAISQRIKSGTIKVGGLRHREGLEKRSIPQNPTYDLLALTKHCDVIIADDRAVNQHPHIEENGHQTPIFSTLGLLDALVSTGAITPVSRLECRIRLRRAGYLFVPVEEEELAHHMHASTVWGNKVVETAELRALRESILLARMTGWLQLPQEADWLFTTITVLIKVLKALWAASDDKVPEIVARSNWIAKQLNVCGWAQHFGVEYGDNLVKAGRGEFILLLITAPSDIPQNLKDAYLRWVEDCFLAPIKEQYPELYKGIVKRQKTIISDIADTEFAGITE